MYNTSSYQFNSLYEAPLPKFGFHPCRVYRFSLFFSKDIVSVALYDLSTMPDGLGLRSVVSKMLPAFIRCSTNTTIIADCGCPDFPLFLAIGSHAVSYTHLRNNMNLPNKLTTIRLLSVPLFIIVYLIPYQSLGIEIPVFDVLSTSLSLLDIILFLIFALSALTDYLDGYIARKQHLITTFGKFIDPIADKLIVNTTLLLLASTHDIHIIIPIIMISRDIIVDAIRLVASQKNVVLSASYLGKAKTMTQMIAICLLLLNNIVFVGLHIPMDQIMIWLATLISFVSGIDYFMKNRQYIMESM